MASGTVVKWVLFPAPLLLDSAHKETFSGIRCTSKVSCKILNYLKNITTSNTNIKNPSWLFSYSMFSFSLKHLIELWPWLCEAGQQNLWWNQERPRTSLLLCFWKMSHWIFVGSTGGPEAPDKRAHCLSGRWLHLNYTDVMRPGCAYKVALSKNTLGSTASRDHGSVYGLAWPTSGPGWANSIWQLYTLPVMLVAAITCSHAGRECPSSCIFTAFLLLKWKKWSLISDHSKH